MSASYTETDIEEIAAKLGGDSRGCLCPAHNDHKPSLSLGVGEGGRLLYHCFAGCSPEDVREALRAKGVLKNGDATGAEPKSKVVATYTYRDEMGQPLYRAVRYEPKRFTLERYEGGRWKKGKGAMGGVRRILYDLPNVIPAKDVVLVEGEKDADNLNALGFVATTCPQGAKSWKKKYAEFLIGKRVYHRLPHNDPAGRLLLEKAASSIRTKAARVAFLNLEGLGEKEDVSDWLARGGTADRLRELIAAAPEWVPKRRRWGSGQRGRPHRGLPQRGEAQRGPAPVRRTAQEHHLHARHRAGDADARGRVRREGDRGPRRRGGRRERRPLPARDPAVLPMPRRAG